MNEDQVIGSIRGLEWALKQIPMSNNSAVKIERELAGLRHRLKGLKGPSQEEIAEQEAREAREQKRIELERRISQMKSHQVEYVYDTPKLIEEPSDYRPLPHFGARE